jgi:hypothetical protein
MSSCKLPCCAAGNSDAVGCRLMVFLIWCHQTYRHTYTARSRIFQCSHHSKSSLIQIAYASVVAAISTQVLAEAWSRLKHGDFSWSRRGGERGPTWSFLRPATLPLRARYSSTAASRRADSLRVIIVPSNEIMVVYIMIRLFSEETSHWLKQSDLNHNNTTWLDNLLEVFSILYGVTSF